MKLLNFNVMYTSVFGCINLDRRDKERHFFLTSRKRDVRFVVIQKLLKGSFCVPKLRQHLIGIHTFIANELLIFFLPKIISVGYKMSSRHRYIWQNITRIKITLIIFLVHVSKFMILNRREILSPHNVE